MGLLLVGYWIHPGTALSPGELSLQEGGRPEGRSISQDKQQLTRLVSSCPGNFQGVPAVSHLPTVSLVGQLVFTIPGRGNLRQEWPPSDRPVGTSVRDFLVSPLVSCALWVVPCLGMGGWAMYKSSLSKPEGTSPLALFCTGLYFSSCPDVPRGWSVT